MYLVQAQRRTKLAHIFLLMFQLSHVRAYFNALTINSREIVLILALIPASDTFFDTFRFKDLLTPFPIFKDVLI